MTFDPSDTEALRELAARERRSMHDIVVLAVRDRLAAAQRNDMLDRSFDEFAAEDVELLDRLGR